MKNKQSLRVRKRTSGPNRPGTRDRRVQKTRASLHNALMGLAREKPYPSIAVKEILDRANVGRSTFYTHFQDKHELLESGILEILQTVHDRPRPGSVVDQIVGFSRPLLEHIDRHRHESGPRMTREGWVVVHGHLRDVLTNYIADALAAAPTRRPTSPDTMSIPAELIAAHVASAFELVLNWWVDNELSLTASEVDAQFRGLVIPTLSGFVGQSR